MYSAAEERKSPLDRDWRGDYFSLMKGKPYTPRPEKEKKSIYDSGIGGEKKARMDEARAHDYTAAQIRKAARKES